MNARCHFVQVASDGSPPPCRGPVERPGAAAGADALVVRLLPVVRARVAAYFARRRGARLAGHDADDLVQEIWLELLQDDGRLLRAFDPERGATFEGYVRRICERELWRRTLKACRQRRGGGVALVSLDQVAAPADPRGDPEATVATRDLLARLGAVLRRTLSARGQLIVRLLYQEGLSPADIADRLRTTPQVVYNCQHRVRTACRAFLKAEIPSRRARESARSSV